jgi:hypothetical protein
MKPGGLCIVGVLGGVSLLCVCGEAGAATAVWDNGWSGGSNGGLPTSTDDVLIRNGNLNWTATLPDTVASWTQEAGYTNVVTIETKYPGQGAFTNLTITGDCVISNGTWTHLNDNTDASAPWVEVSRLCVKVGGDLLLTGSAHETMGTGT